MIFTHTYQEGNTWQGWFKNGSQIEVARGRCALGIRITTFAKQVGSSYNLWLGLGFIQAFIPVAFTPRQWSFGEGPSWGIQLSLVEIILNWNRAWKFVPWPFHTILLSRHYEGKDGQWIDDRPHYRNDAGEYEYKAGAKSSTHDYYYVLQSGKQQKVRATIIRERWIKGRHILSKLGWPSRTEYTIDVQFSDEIGERTGSWKGGCVGCGYGMKKGETPIMTLRRMEAERVFD